MNRNLIFIHGYTNCVAHNDLITWVSKYSWEMLISEFSQTESIIPRPRKIICNNCEQMNLLGDILNADYNVYDQGDYRFRGSFFKTAPTIINDYTENKFLNMQLENLRPQINIENNDKKSDERYNRNVIYDKEYYERDRIGEDNEQTLNTYIEVLKLRKLSSQKNIGYPEKYSDERYEINMIDAKDSDERFHIG